MRCVFFFPLQPIIYCLDCRKAHYPQTDRRTHEGTAGECDYGGCEKSLAICGFMGGKIRRQKIYTLTLQNGVLLRHNPIAVPMRKPGRGGCLIAAASRFFFYNVGIHADFRRGKIWWQRIYTCESEIYLQPAVSRKLHKSVNVLAASSPFNTADHLSFYVGSFHNHRPQSVSHAIYLPTSI